MGLSKVEITTRRADAALAELWITAQADSISATSELRGRIVGPRCEGRTTIEVAYPLRPFEPKPADTQLAARVAIPEPSLWQPEHPFVYDAVIELWQNGQCSHQHRITGYRILKTRDT